MRSYSRRLVFFIEKTLKKTWLNCIAKKFSVNGAFQVSYPLLSWKMFIDDYLVPFVLKILHFLGKSRAYIPARAAKR